MCVDLRRGRDRCFAGKRTWAPSRFVARLHRNCDGSLTGSGVELFAEASAFGQIHHQGLCQERLALSLGPLELLMATVHVFEQVFHPKQGVLSIPHAGNPYLESMKGR
jgi:hypothetical protein